MYLWDLQLKLNNIWIRETKTQQTEQIENASSLPKNNFWRPVIFFYYDM